jgi:hypothetical protein
MPIPHVYERVTSVTQTESGCEIALEDGTSFWLPPEAHKDYERLSVGDKILIDCSEHTIARPFPARINMFHGCASIPFASFALGPPARRIDSPTLQVPMWRNS